MFDKYINQLIVTKVFTFEEDRILMMNKVPFVIFPARSMARFIQTVSEDIGTEVISKIAYNAGEIVADEFIKEYNWIKVNLPGKMASIQKMFEVMGFGAVNVKMWDTKKNKMLLTVINNPTIEWGNKMYKEKELICPFYMAIFSAHAHKELSINQCHFIETQCICKGAKFCEWSYNVFKDKVNSKKEFTELQKDTFAIKQEEANKNRPVLDAKPALEVNPPALNVNPNAESKPILENKDVKPAADKQVMTETK